MDEIDNPDDEQPFGIVEDAQGEVEAAEIVVYEWTLYRNGNPERSGRCVTTEVDENTVKVVGAGDVEPHSNPMTGSHTGIDTYYSHVFVLGRQDSFETEPKYKMTVHPDDVAGEFLSL